jgi:23S rRNA pseudouridine1911/1915/1917 synthase
VTEPLRILHEDDHLLFVDKPAGVVVQQSQDPEEPFLFTVAEDYLREKAQRPYLLQRLDRGTTGVMFFSKSSEMNARLTRQFEKKQIRKTYAAIATGHIGQAQLIDAAIGRIGPISFGVIDDGRRALTSLEPMAWGSTATLLRIRLLTGRTHQIRVHLSAIGHPLVGDWLYGERDEGRPLLHSMRIDMIHPATGQPLAVEAPLPDDFAQMFPDGHRLLRIVE